MNVGWGLRARLTAWCAGLLIVVLVLLGMVVYDRFSAMLRLRTETGLRSRLDHVASLVGAPMPGVARRPPLAELSESRVIEGLSGEGGLIEITDSRGAAVSRSHALADRPLAPPSAVRAARAGRRTLEPAVVPGMGRYLVFTAPLVYSGGLVGVAEVGVPLARITEPQANLLAVLLAGGALAVAVTVVGGYVIASQALTPIDRIIATVRAIGGNGALDRRIRLTGPDDEVGRLARVFDEMLERIERVVTRERRFTADAAHELRTPLTILKGEIDLALRHDRSPAEYRTALTELAAETDRLSLLADGLLLLARADAGALALTPRSVHIPELAAWVKHHFAQPALEKSVALEVCGADAIVWGDPDRLRQLITNLVNNALAHTPAGGSATVRWRCEGAWTTLDVADTGCGIAAEDLPHVFDRFYRGANYDRAPGAAGLGLAIAKWIVQAHQGTIEIASEPGRGTTVSVWLPASFDALAQSRFDYWLQYHDDPERV
ncbi:MAG TPA: HAMP domain-containing sensor histidine kinase [bacterium]|nr:HAMP domain-containing sensor histidine kinase [bacterium]